eukprot:4708005-Ditylum_brightwellii.AAC.1
MLYDDGMRRYGGSSRRNGMNGSGYSITTSTRAAATATTTIVNGKFGQQVGLSKASSSPTKASYSLGIRSY